MLQVQFSNKGGSNGDTTPSVNLSKLKPFLGKTKLKQGDTIVLRLVSESGEIADFDFTVNRKNLSTAKANGWNSAVFGEVYNGEPLTLGVCAATVVRKTGPQKIAKVASTSHYYSARSASKKSSSRRILNKPSKRQLQSVLKAANGVKSVAAWHFGVHPRSLGRWLESYNLA